MARVCVDDRRRRLAGDGRRRPAARPPDPGGNPLAVEGAVGDTLRAVADFAITALLFAILVSAVSLLLRFRRARGQQRQQLKWLAYGGGLFAALLVIAMVDLQAPRLWNAVLETLTFGALYVGVGVAVLRYRLWTSTG
jgi:hypothetical protein